MYYLVTIFIILLITISSGIYGQDVLYRSNGEKVMVKVLLKNRHELTYTRSGDERNTVYHISTSALDSALYQDGTKDVYVFERLSSIRPQPDNPVYGHHLIGLDIGAILFYNQSLSLSYEYQLVNRHLGIKIMFGTDLKEAEYYDFDLSAGATKKGHFSRVGLNWYIFPPGSFRVSTGLHFIASKYDIKGEKWIYEEDPPYGSHLEYVEAERKYRNVVLNGSVYYQIVNHLIMSAGIDFPARGPGDPGAVFRSEILINF
jgi:hypothetical protein